MSEPVTLTQPRQPGRPSLASVGLAALSKSDRNRRWRAGRGLRVLHVEVPAALADRLRQLREARGLSFATLLEAALVALEEPTAIEIPPPQEPDPVAEPVEAAAPPLGRYYSPDEDVVLLSLGPEAERHRVCGVGASWEDAVATMGRSTAPALRARFLKIEPIADRERRTGISAGRSARAKRRPCMVCGRAFESCGYHNRLCDPCRETAW